MSWVRIPLGTLQKPWKNFQGFFRMHTSGPFIKKVEKRQEKEKHSGFRHIFMKMRDRLDRFAEKRYEDQGFVQG
jgi:hypothetical protein